MEMKNLRSDVWTEEFRFDQSIVQSIVEEKQTINRLIFDIG